MRIILPVCFLFLLLSCQKVEKDKMVSISDGVLNANFPGISLSGGRPGIELLTGEDENALNWFPEETGAFDKKERITPQGNAIDYSVTWHDSNGYELTWTLCKLNDKPGFTLRSSFKNNSKDPVRLKNFIICKTPQDGFVSTGDPASWWLLPAMNNYSRQAGNLAQVFPSKKRLVEQKVYGVSLSRDNSPRDIDGHWRYLDEAITLYSDKDRSGLAMGAVGPGVSYVKFNCRVDSGKILVEIISEMDEIIVDPGESRESEEVLFLAQPYEEALTNLFSWVAETHNARTKREPIYGWCSWYDRYFDIDAQHILNITKAVKEIHEIAPLQIIQIDDGWQKSAGDWTANDKFPAGMKFYADKIIDAGSIPGIWMSPIRCLLPKPSEWFQNKNGDYFDPTHPEAEKFMSSSIQGMKDAGFRYFKFDYNEIGTYRPYNPKMTSFQIMRHLFTIYRQAIGEESFMLACGAPMRPVVGLADASRIGFDVIARWKSYPLADDNLSPLPADVFNGIITTAVSSMVNDRLYFNDPDITYLLPRAENRLWLGPEELFNPEKHGLKWSELKSFHSYFGLLGGMAMVSEPLYETKYRQQNPLRMLSILSPTAPDKGWSMNGDIDPWGRQFGFVAERSWGNFASVVLWNKEDISSDLRLDTHTLQAIGKKFYVWSFWDDEFMGIGDSTFIAKNIIQRGCALLRLTQIPEQNDLPLLIGSNLHISMGSAELESISTKTNEMKIGLTNAGARDGKIFIYSAVPLKVTNATGCEAFVLPQQENIYAVIINDRSRTEENTISLSKDNMPKSASEILKDPDLVKKFKKSGFNNDEMR